MSLADTLLKDCLESTSPPQNNTSPVDDDALNFEIESFLTMSSTDHASVDVPASSSSAPPTLFPNDHKQDHPLNASAVNRLLQITNENPKDRSADIAR